MQPASRSEPQLSVIVPCFKESTRLPATLPRMVEFLEGCGHSYELLIVDDGSPDDTSEIASQAALRNPRVHVHRYEPNRGKGFAVAYGAARTRGEWVLFTDADLSTPLEELHRMIPYLERGFDVVIASRGLKDSVLKIRQPWYRERLGRMLNVVIRKLSGLRFRDTQCGFKLFSRQAALDVFPNLTVCGWMFDVEALILARKQGYDIAEVPVTWINSDESRLNIFQALPKVVRELLHIRMHWWRRQPERHAREEAGIAAQSSP
jgi:dolichyl-phosphate beta-glucosyltransferase